MIKRINPAIMSDAIITISISLLFLKGYLLSFSISNRRTSLVSFSTSSINCGTLFSRSRIEGSNFFFPNFQSLTQDSLIDVLCYILVVGLEMAIDFVRSGDTLVVWRLDRLGRNMEDLISIVNRLNERGVSFHSLQENITMDKSSSTGQLMFHLFAAFAEFERNLILERSAAGRAAARARGRFGGRPEKLKAQDLELLKTLVDSGTPIKTIAERWNVSRTTIYRYLDKMEEKDGKTNAH